MSSSEQQALRRQPIPSSTLDMVLTTQLAIAWAGEEGEEPRRLGWWRSDLTSEFGGHDLFKRLLPKTWEWAALQAVQEAARRRDAEQRSRHHDPDRLLTIFYLGFDVDERVGERFQDLKRSGESPASALPGLAEVTAARWDAVGFGDWIQGHGESDFVSAPEGRRVKGAPPESLELLMNRLVAACWPLTDAYPLPHFRRPK